MYFTGVLNPSVGTGAVINAVALTDSSQVTLPDGRIVVAGGFTQAGAANATVYIGTPGVGATSDVITWVACSSGLPTALGAGAMTLLQDGRILWYGGATSSTTFGTPSSSAYIGVVSGANITWTTATGTAILQYCRHTLTTLADGRVLLVGGHNGGASNLINSSCWIGSISVNVLTWSSLAPLPMPFAKAGHTSTLLPDGRVCIAGGESVLGVYSNSSYLCTVAPPLATINAFSATFSITVTLGVLTDSLMTLATTPTYPVAVGQAYYSSTYGLVFTVLSQGTGTGGAGTYHISLNMSGTGTLSVSQVPSVSFTVGTNLPTARSEHAMSLLQDGRLLLSGGYDGVASRSDTFFGTIAGDVTTWVAGTAMQYPRYNHTSSVLLDGRIVLAAGADTTSGAKSDVFLGAITANVISWVNTLAKFQADLIGLMTGTITNVSQLSSNFLSATMISTVAPGWSLHDDTAGPSVLGLTPKVLKAPWSDDATKFKYVELDALNSATLYLNGYNTWDAVNNVGTDPVQVSPVLGNFQSLPLVGNSQIILACNSKGFYIQVSANLTSAATTWVLLSEHSRDDPWNTVLNGYPSWSQSGGYNSVPSSCNGAFPRMFNPSSGTDVTSVLFSTSNLSNPGIALVPSGLLPNSANLVSSGGGALGGINNATPMMVGNTVGADANKAASKYLFEVALRTYLPTNSYSTGAILGGSISSVNPFMYFVGSGVGAIGDSLFVGANEYILVGNFSNVNIRVAIRKE